MEGTTIEERFAVKNPDLIQLYSIATPNGIKAAACLEELVLLKQGDFEFNYEPHSVDIRHAENKTEQFTNLSPNQKIPVIVDPHAGNGQQSVKVFESGAILLYLAEKYDELLPHDVVQRAEVLKWLFWGSTGLSSSVKQFGFYYHYCQHSLPYCVARFKKEVTRLLSVLDSQLSHGRNFVTGGKRFYICVLEKAHYQPSRCADMYTIADISIWPWIYGLHENYGDAVQVGNNHRHLLYFSLPFANS